MGEPGLGPEGRDGGGGGRDLRALLGGLEVGDVPAAGYRLRGLSRGRTIGLHFDKGGEPFEVWLRPAREETGCYRQTARFRLGYTGRPPDGGAYTLLDRLAERIVEGERGMSERALRALFRPGADPGDLTLVEGGATLELRLTLRCNERCPFCNSSEFADNLLEAPGAARAAIEAAAARGVRRVVLTGGEPTLLPELPELVSLARRLGLQVTIQTNGRLCRAAAWWGRFEALPTTLFVSFHTRHPTRLEAITGVAGGLEDKVQAVRVALDLGIEVVLNLVITTLNMDEVGDYPAWVARTFGTALALELSVLAPNERAAENLHLMARASEIAPGIERALAAAAALGMRAEVPEVCGLPLCVLPGSRSQFAASRRRAPVVTLAADRRKAESCRACRFDARCIGVWSRYVDTWGFEEFRPVIAPTGQEEG